MTNGPANAFTSDLPSLERRFLQHTDSFPEPGRGALLRAYEVARVRHARQTRDEGTPYIVHPLRVALTLIEDTGSTDVTLIAAALLHDTLEDTNLTFKELLDQFGDDIAEVVRTLTKPKGKSDLESKYLGGILRAPLGTRLVKVADRLDNVRSLQFTPRLGKIVRYVYETRAEFLPLARQTHPLLAEHLEAALEVVERNLPTQRYWGFRRPPPWRGR